MKRDIAVVLVIKFLAIGLNFSGLAALSNTMSVQDFGFFATMFSVGLILSIPAMLGLNFSLVRYASETSRPLESRIGLSQDMLAALAKILGLVLLLGAAGGLAFDFLATSRIGAPDVAATLAFGLAYAFSEVLQSVARNFDGSVRAFVYREVGWRASFFLIALANIASPAPMSAALTLALLALALLVTVALQLRGSRLSWRSEVGASGARADDRREIWRQTPSFMLASTMSTASQHVVVVLSGIALTLDGTAHFFTSLKIMQMLSLSVLAVNFVLTPRLRGFLIGGTDVSDTRMISAVCTASAWINLAFCLGGMAIFAVFGNTILGLFGPEYAQDKVYLMILSISALINAMTGPSGFVLVMFDRQRQFNLVSAISMTSGALLCVLLGQAYGLAGFCWGYVGWTAIQNLGTALAALRCLRINATFVGVPALGALAK